MIDRFKSYQVSKEYLGWLFIYLLWGHERPPRPPANAPAVLKRWAAGRPPPGSREGGSARGREAGCGRGGAGRRAASRGATSCARRRVGAEPSSGWPVGVPLPALLTSDVFREQRWGRQYFMSIIIYQLYIGLFKMTGLIIIMYVT